MWSFVVFSGWGIETEEEVSGALPHAIIASYVAAL
jgi:hypothetical protein